MTTQIVQIVSTQQQKENKLQEAQIKPNNEDSKRYLKVMEIWDMLILLQFVTLICNEMSVMLER